MKFTPEERQRMLDLRIQGLMPREIAEIMDCKANQVSWVVTYLKKGKNVVKTPAKPVPVWPEGIIFEDVDELTLTRERLGPMPGFPEPRRTLAGVTAYGR